MARYSGSVCRICRREGMKLFLKGERCYTDKCAFERRGYPPGQHGQTRGKMSEYALQLREKQKVRRLYGLGETQFKNLFAKAERKKGITGETLMSLLERRLDNVLYKSGFSTSRRGVRMMISHGLFMVDGRKVTIPSYSVSVNETIDVAGKEEDRAKISENLKLTEGRPSPQWMAVDRNALKATVLRLPVRADITMPPIEEHLIVGLYSK
ncbi:MAG TPA: 30S ribosomal protein S4 [Thermodesulfobacteriota bacterium]|nr:30S ribosomal protein S4 [Thermodesulfobacteriota bacterium]